MISKQHSLVLTPDTLKHCPYPVHGTRLSLRPSLKHPHRKGPALGGRSVHLLSRPFAEADILLILKILECHLIHLLMIHACHGYASMLTSGAQRVKLMAIGQSNI